MCNCNNVWAITMNDDLRAQYVTSPFKSIYHDSLVYNLGTRVSTTDKRFLNTNIFVVEID